MSEKQIVTLSVNGKSYEQLVEARTTLADFLRNELDLTGTHLGCEHGVCGACTVLIEGKAARSCLMLAVQAEGAQLTTIEGLADGGEMHPLQVLFSNHRALQCGFCTPGMLVAAIDLVAGAEMLTPDDIRHGMSSVLCRCTGYDGIVRAVKEYAASQGKLAAAGDGRK